MADPCENDGNNQKFLRIGTIGVYLRATFARCSNNKHMLRITLGLVFTLLLAVGAWHLSQKSFTLATWYMVDVSLDGLQGDANLIQVGDTIVLIDTGYYFQAQKGLLPVLEKLQIQRIHHLFISHAHRDHYQGLKLLHDRGIKIDRIYFKPPPKHICKREVPWGCHYDEVIGNIERARSQWNIPVENPKTGFELDLSDEVKLTLLHAQEDDLPNTKIDVNDLSLIMQLRVGENTVLFTGDLNRNLSNYLTQVLNVDSDILKMPHHGGRSLASIAFFDAVSPDTVLVPGPGWIWCSERGDEPRTWVSQEKIDAYINGLHGTVSVRFGLDRYQIESERNLTCEQVL